MARNTRPRKAAQPETPYKCRDCQHSYDWNNRSFYDGHLICCRCHFYKEGKFCKFLSDDACDKFVKRKDSDNAKTQ